MFGSCFGQKHFASRVRELAAARGAYEVRRRQASDEQGASNVDGVYGTQYTRPEPDGFPAVQVPIRGIFMIGTRLENCKELALSYQGFRNRYLHANDLGDKSFEAANSKFWMLRREDSLTFGHAALAAVFRTWCFFGNVPFPGFRWWPATKAASQPMDRSDPSRAAFAPLR
jgi:hypothetical protein